MSDAKFTPGPWGTYLNNMEDIVIRKMNKDGYEEQCIARHVSYKNAALIAAAPDLHEALKTFVDTWSNESGFSNPSYEDVQKAVSALAKARGESC